MYNNSYLAATTFGDGKHMELVEKWKVQNNKSNDMEENLSNFMKEIYEIYEEGMNFLEILKTMISPEGRRGVEET